MSTLPTMLSLSAMQSLIFYASRTEGAIVEVGVYRGGSASFLAHLERPLFLYDTFTGLPYQGPLDGNEVGRFSDTSAEAVQAAIPTATVIKGIFPDSLIDMPPVGFVHADADQYETTKAILEHMPQRMLRGGMILFDDYLVADCQGCTQAVDESGYSVLIIKDTGKGLIII